MKQITCAIIGCGPGTEGKGGVHSISYAHGWAFVGDRRTRLVAAASRTPENRENFANEFSGTTLYADYREMLSLEKAELVSICGFPQDREAMVSAALEAGARILWVEKPFALSLGEGRRMQDAARRAGARIFVNHQRRMGKVFAWFRACVSSGKLGDLYSVEVVQPGPCIHEFGPHLVDAALSVLGDRKPAHIFGAVDMSQPIENKGLFFERNLLATVTYEDGVRLHLQAGEISSKSPILRANGSRGFAELHVTLGPGMKSVFRTLSDEHLGVENPESKEHFHHSETDGQIFYGRALDHLLSAVATERPSMLDVEEAMKGVEITVGAFESARLRRALSFPITQEDFPLKLEW